MGKKQKKKQQERAAQSPVIAEELTSTNGHRNFIRIQSLIVFAFAFLLYANTIGHDYAVDDTIVIVKNTLTTQGFKGIPKIMTTDAFYGFFGEGYKLVEGGRYRPLSIVTFAIEYQFFGLNPHISHFVNVVLYGLLGVLVFQLLLQFFQIPKLDKFKLTVPFIAALFFVGHPIHTEVVANIKGRDEIMGMLFSILTVYLIVLYVKNNKLSLLLLALFSYVLALFSKENTITFLAVVPLTLFFFTNRDMPVTFANFFNYSNLKKYLVTGIPMLILAAIYVYLRSQFTEADIGKSSIEILNNPFVHATMAERYATISYSFGAYIKLLLFPHPLTHDYYFNQVPIINWGNPKAIIPLIINLAIVAYAVKAFFSRNPISYGIWFYYITLSVVSNLFFTVGIVMNERFIFIPSLGFCLILAILLVKLGNYLKEKNWSAREVLHPKFVTAVMIIILLGYSLKTFTRNRDWKNDFTLFAADVKNSPNSAKIHNAYGGELLSQADKTNDPALKLKYEKKAEKVLARALEIYPNYLNALLLMGNAKYKLNKSPEEAESYYKKTLQMKPNYFEGNFNMGCVLIENDQARESIPYFKKAIKSKPQKFEARYNLAEAYYKINEPDSAIAAYNEALKLSPNNAGIYYKIGLSYGKLKNDLPNSITYLKKAVELDPNNMMYYEDLGVAYGFNKDYQHAIEILQKAIKVNPNYAKAYFNLGITYKQLGQEDKATEYFNKAKSLDPKLNF